MREISPKTIMYILISLLIIAVILHIVTNNGKYIYLVILIGGLVGVLKPRIILDFFEQEYQQGKTIMEPWFSEKVYKAIGFVGGLFLVIVALAKLIFNFEI